MWAASREGKQESAKSNSKDRLFSCQRVTAAGKRSCDERQSSTTTAGKKAKASGLITDGSACKSIISPQRSARSLSLPQDISDQGIRQDVSGSLVEYSTNVATQTSTNEKKQSASEASDKKPGSARRNEDEKGIIKKPKRPMSTYNFFFKEERSLIAAALSSAKTRDEINQVLTSFGARESELQPEHETHETLPSVKKKKFNGTVSFEDIGKIIGRRWRSLDKKTFAKYNALAEADSARYRDAIDKYYEEYDADRKARPHLYLPSQKEESPATFDGMQSFLSHDIIDLDQNNSFSMETASARGNDSTAEDRFRSESTVVSPQQNPVVASPFGHASSLGLQHLLQSIPSGYNGISQSLAEILATVQPQFQVQPVGSGGLLPSVQQQITDLIVLNSLLQTRSSPILRQTLIPLGFGLLPQQSNFANINYALPAAIGSVPYINLPLSEIAPLLQPSFQVAPQQQQQSIGGVSLEALQLLLALSHANSNSNGNGTASGTSNWNFFS